MPLDLNLVTKFSIKEYAVAYMAMRNPIFEQLQHYYKDRLEQGLLNNLWDYNPGEMDRWADDGGRGREENAGHV